jgi:hypothetical protein
LARARVWLLPAPVLLPFVAGAVRGVALAADAALVRRRRIVDSSPTLSVTVSPGEHCADLEASAEGLNVAAECREAYVGLSALDLGHVLLGHVESVSDDGLCEVEPSPELTEHLCLVLLYACAASRVDIDWRPPGTQGWSYPVFEELWNYGFPQEMEHFARCVRGLEEPIATGRDGRVAQELLFAGYRSAGVGARVALPFDPGAAAKPIDLWLQPLAAGGE